MGIKKTMLYLNSVFSYTTLFLVLADSLRNVFSWIVFSGWSNRQQFEEIWTKMLGVLVSQQSLINPQQNGQVLL